MRNDNHASLTAKSSLNSYFRHIQVNLSTNEITVPISSYNHGRLIVQSAIETVVGSKEISSSSSSGRDTMAALTDWWTQTGQSVSRSVFCPAAAAVSIRHFQFKRHGRRRTIVSAPAWAAAVYRSGERRRRGQQLNERSRWLHPSIHPSIPAPSVQRWYGERRPISWTRRRLLSYDFDRWSRFACSDRSVTLWPPLLFRRSFLVARSSTNYYAAFAEQLPPISFHLSCVKALPYRRIAATPHGHLQKHCLLQRNKKIRRTKLLWKAV